MGFCSYLLDIFILGKQRKTLYVPEREGEKKKPKPFEMCYYLLISLIRLNTSTQGVYRSPALPSDHLSRLTFSLMDVLLAEDVGIPLHGSICRMTAVTGALVATVLGRNTGHVKAHCCHSAPKRALNLLLGWDKAFSSWMLAALEKSQVLARSSWQAKPAGRELAAAGSLFPGCVNPGKIEGKPSSAGTCQPHPSGGADLGRRRL